MESRRTDFYEIVQGRGSIRKFKEDRVPQEDIEEIVRLATLAPNAGNRQMWYFVAVSNKEVLKKMRNAVIAEIEKIASWPEAKGQEQRIGSIKEYATFFADAPLTIAVFCEPYLSATDELLLAHGAKREEIDRLRARPDLQSIGAAIQTLLLAAYAKGYGTCWMCSPVLAYRQIEEILGVKESYHLVALIPLGKPAEEPAPKSRKRVEEVLKIVA